MPSSGPRTLDDLARPGGAPTGWRLWVAGARLRTVPVSVGPVLVGTACAAAGGGVTWWRAALALVVSVTVQVGTNYGNDYSDGIRGTDAERIGPVRLVAQGFASPRAVLTASVLTFAVGAVAGLVLAAATSWWLVAVGAACIAAGWLYTGGPAPYGYRALGDLSVFVFFGLVAVAGTAYVAADRPRVTGLAVLAGVPVGLLAVGLLVANNLRDIPTDTATGKRTLAVLMGDARSRVLYAGCLLVPYALLAPLAVSRPAALLALLSLPVALRPVAAVRRGDTGRELVASLLDTARVGLAFCVALAVGLAL